MTPISFFVRLSVAAVPFACCPVSLAATGDVDTTFNPNAGSRVLSTALQGGGKILVAGDFTSIDGQPRSRIARLNPDGTLDPDFAPDVNDTVACMAVLADGDIVIGGEFTTVGGVTRRRLARLNENGSLDEAFDPNVTGGTTIVNCVALQTDGKLLLGGNFTSVAGTTRNRIARLNVNGTLDAAFNPNAGGPVRCIGVQPDGKIVVGGQFGTIAGGVRNFLARVGADGVLDAAFDPGVNNIVYCVVPQRDGKIIISGEFTAVGTGTDVRSYTARLDATGKLEPGFNPATNGPARCVAFQTDGKIILGGDFMLLGTTERRRLARVGADGVLDATFDPDANNQVYSLSVQADGKIIAGGSFTNVGTQSRNRLARLENDAATEALTVPTVSRVQWLRGGASAEALGVVFQLSETAGGPWSLLGPGVRTAAGWELAGQNLPGSGQVRGLAFTTGGQYNGSPGVVESVKPFVFEPEIVVEQPEGTSLVSDAGAVNFGAMIPGGSKVLTFTIRNTGLHNLTGLGIILDGENAGEFVASPPAATVPAGGNTKFTLTYTPAQAGSPDAVLVLASNDTDENPFRISLAAKVLVPEADEDKDGMTNAAEVMLSASGFDPLTDSAAKIGQLRAAGVFPASDIHALSLTQPVLERNPVTGHFLLRIGVEKSPDMSSWSLLPDTVDFDIVSEGAGPFFYRVFGKRP